MCGRYKSITGSYIDSAVVIYREMTILIETDMANLKMSTNYKFYFGFLFPITTRSTR